MNETPWLDGLLRPPASDMAAPWPGGRDHEDWEEWLRWDPAADATSPDDGTFHSGGSSKNESPVHEPAWPVEAQLGGKNDTLAPPLIWGEDSLDESLNDTSLFGGSTTTAGFDFPPLSVASPPPTNMPRVDVNVAPWPLHSSNAEPPSITLSALSEDGRPSISSTGAWSSNAPSLQYSPVSPSDVGAPGSSNSPDPPRKRAGRKRKAEMEREREQEQNGGDSPEDGDGPPVKKTSHNVIEKRYRNNLNDKIVELRNSVPSLRAMGRTSTTGGGGGGESEDLEGLTPAHKLNKATVMAKATEYIRHLEKRNKTMADQMDALRARLSVVETAIGPSTDAPTSAGGGLAPTGAARSRHTSMSMQAGEPDFWGPYNPSSSHPTYPRPPAEAQNRARPTNTRRGGGALNKVMLGTMAGIMVMEGMQQNGDESQPYALSALPIQIFRRGIDAPLPTSPAAFARQAAVPLLKLSLLVAVLLHLLAPLFSFSARRKQKSRATAVRLPPAPSLASPIEVRRKAWLTAIQTVWVPKHFLLEVAVVTAKMIGLSVRRMVGTEAFNSLTGANKEDETARIKAWDIAIDAQLAGGDAQVSYYRLLLTLMESGTLPDSPTRLMQKAVHFRVFFWEVANAGYGNMVGFTQLTEKVGKIYWDSARRLQKELTQRHAGVPGRPRADDEASEPLPDHLARLVELDCDDVLSNEMIQRAWNLAWNKQSAHAVGADAARDAVVEDHAIRSPLDAVAAWYAHMTIDDTLAESLHDSASSIDTEYYIGLAVMVAPPGSATQARALAAKAILSHRNRGANILAALDALPTATDAASLSGASVNLVSHLPAAPDVRAALTLAKLLALCAPSATRPAAAHAHAIPALRSLPNHLAAPGAFTLLTAAGALRLLRLLAADRRLTRPAQRGLADLAAHLRLWIGSSPCSSSCPSLDRADRAVVVDLCVAVAKRVGGWNVDEDRDSGYGSADASPVREKTLGFVAVGES